VLPPRRPTEDGRVAVEFRIAGVITGRVCKSIRGSTLFRARVSSDCKRDAISGGSASCGDARKASSSRVLAP
jgi:hypothetical protein